MPEQEAEEMTMAIAKGELSKDDVTKVLRGHIVSESEQT